MARSYKVKYWKSSGISEEAIIHGVEAVTSDSRKPKYRAFWATKWLDLLADFEDVIAVLPAGDGKT